MEKNLDPDGFKFWSTGGCLKDRIGRNGSDLFRQLLFYR